MLHRRITIKKFSSFARVSSANPIHVYAFSTQSQVAFVLIWIIALSRMLDKIYLRYHAKLVILWHPCHLAIPKNLNCKILLLTING